MQIRALLQTVARAAVLVGVISTGGACTHPSAHLMVDAPRLLPYEAPDIDELTGIDSDEEGEEGDGSGSGSAQAPKK